MGMAVTSRDIVPFSRVRANLTEIAEEVRAGAEKIITRNGEGYVALIDARRLDHYHALEREHIHLLLLQEVVAGLDDIDAGRTLSIEELKARFGR
jgi:prevent-host-death family protein